MGNECEVKRSTKSALDIECSARLKGVSTTTKSHVLFEGKRNIFTSAYHIIVKWIGLEILQEPVYSSVNSRLISSAIVVVHTYIAPMPRIGDEQWDMLTVAQTRIVHIDWQDM